MAPRSLRAALALVAPLALTAEAAASELDLSNWMGQLAPVVGNATLLDLSLPGAHDAMTYDLSTDLSDGYEGIGPVTSRLLHSLTPLVAGHFIRRQGQTQGISITDMLDAGIRFIDFRIMHSKASDHVLGRSHWYCLHGCQTKQRAVEYLKQIRVWLDEHPKEVVVMWASRHGNTDSTGTDQYPGTKPAQRQSFFREVQETFGGLLVDSSQGRLNETSLHELWRRNERLVWFASDFVESTNASARALDARSIDNRLAGGGWHMGALPILRRGSQELATTRAQDRLLLVSMAPGGDEEYIAWSAKISFIPSVLESHKKLREACARHFQIPGMTRWCPPALMDLSLLSNFYNQRVLEAAYTEGSTDASVDFPNAIYIDALDHGGLIRTGTAKINPLDQAKDDRAVEDHATDGYAYAATVVAVNVRRLCRRGSEQPACAELRATAEAARTQRPLRLWEDGEHGRHADWPPLPLAAELSNTSIEGRPTASTITV